MLYLHRQLDIEAFGCNFESSIAEVNLVSNSRCGLRHDIVVVNNWLNNLVSDLLTSGIPCKTHNTQEIWLF